MKIVSTNPHFMAKSIMESVKAASLCTLDRQTGHPIATLTNVAFTPNPLLIMSKLATHRANIEADNRMSLLLITKGKGDALAHPRLTLIGKAHAVNKETHREAFLKAHPKAKLYIDFADFACFEMQVETMHFNGGFGRAVSVSWEDVI